MKDRDPYSLSLDVELPDQISLLDISAAKRIQSEHLKQNFQYDEKVNKKWYAIFRMMMIMISHTLNYVCSIRPLIVGDQILYTDMMGEKKMPNTKINTNTWDHTS